MRVYNVCFTLTFAVIFLHISQRNARTLNGNQFVVIEGDMMVDKWFVNHTRRISKRGAILKSKSHSFYWPGTTSKGSRIVRVPYSLNTGFFSKLFGTGPVKAFRKAVKQFNKRTCIRFEEKTDKDKDYIEIVKGSGCWAQIGRRSGRQQLSLGKGCDTRGRAIHEIMHAIGFLHEQSREDRDQHVVVLYQNIPEARRSEFATYDQDTGNLPYDFHSIMHYDNKFFSKNGENTIEARIDPKMRLGQSSGFSALDVVRINMLYKCPELQKNLVLYFITVYTSDVSFAGTDLQVDILLAGKKGDSGEVELESTDEVPDPFERGSNQTFPVISPNIGKFKTLRVRLAKSTWYNWWQPNGWKLERVEIETPNKKKILLKYNDWMYPGDHVILKP
ncbi:high choriolytic enzyme 1-like [Oculina patagonica]